MSQQDVILALEEAAKVAGKAGAKAFLQEVAKDGGALDLEAKELMAKQGIAAEIAAIAEPLVKQAVLGLVGQL